MEDARARNETTAILSLDSSGATTTTTTTAAETTTTTTTITGSELDIGTVLPICFLFLFMLTLVVCVRYHLYSSSYKSLVKRIRRSLRATAEAESVDEEMFRPPPVYETAVTMPRPCVCGAECVKTCRVNPGYECNINDDENISEPQTTITTSNYSKNCPCGCHTEADSNVKYRSINVPIEFNTETDDPADTCTVEVSLDLPEVHNGAFVVLEHVQRMAQNPDIAPHYLPSYQEYIEEFPQGNIYV